MRELSARERVLLLHRAQLEDRAPDPAIRNTMPREQAREFNHYIALANATLHVITARALVLHGEVEALSWKLLLLGTHVQWGYDRTTLLLSASLLASIPIQVEDYERQLEELRRERLSVKDIAELIEHSDADGAPPSARQAERDVRAAIQSGDLPAKKRGRRFEVEMGALFDWMGEQLEPRPERGWRYEPVSDDQREQHALRFSAVEWMNDQAGNGPSHPARVLSEVARAHGTAAPAEDSAPANDHDRLTRALASIVQAEIPSLAAQLATIETAAREICVEFQDDAVIPDEVQGFLTSSRGRLEEAARLASTLVGEVPLSTEPDEDRLSVVRAQIRAQEAL